MSTTQHDFLELFDRVDARIGKMEERTLARIGEVEQTVACSVADVKEKVEAKLGAVESRITALESIRNKALLIYSGATLALSVVIGAAWRWIWERATGRNP